MTILNIVFAATVGFLFGYLVVLFFFQDADATPVTKENVTCYYDSRLTSGSNLETGWRCK